jgi:hypothetical protein
MNSLAASWTSGFIATVVVSVFMVLQSVTGIASEASFIGIITQFANERMVIPGSAVGWGVHFFVGVVIYGLVFALVNYLMRTRTGVIKGVMLVLMFWVLMNIAFVPMLGYGLFGFKQGAAIFLVTLVMHIIYGLALGLSYDKLHKPAADALP